MINLRPILSLFIITLLIPNISYTQKSELASGEVYKLETPETGIYKLDYNFFKNLEGFDVDNVNPNHIAVFGQGGYMLPETNNSPRINDVEQLSIYIKGGDDNKFNSSDYILFYGEGIKNFKFNQDSNKYEYEEHLYDNSNYYFLKTLNTTADHISLANMPLNAEFTITETERLQAHNLDKVNLLGTFFSTHGSGKIWYGEAFSNNNRVHHFSKYFNFSNIKTDIPIAFSSNYAVRSESSSNMKISLGDHSFSKLNGTLNKGTAYGIFAKNSTISKEVLITEDAVIDFEISKTSKELEAWLDYIKIISSHHIKYNNEALVIQNLESKIYESAQFSIIDIRSSNFIWNITNILHPESYTLQNNKVIFSTDNKTQTFYVFDPNDKEQLLTPKNANKINNQNLHETGEIDMLIIYHKDFEEQAERLAQHRRDFNNYIVSSVDVSLIYNEFSSGKSDPSAIRDYVKFLKDKYSKFKYLLLFGDGSYDYRGLTDLPKQNFIPVFETKESLSPIRAFPCDDYYALLDPVEGGELKGGLDIGVGRLPVVNANQSKIVVDKIIRYETDPKMHGEWRLNLTFCADDEDSSSHLSQTESIANSFSKDHPEFNVDKIYFDAYEQISTPGGHRYPAVTNRINNNVFQGQLMLNYLGHGGPTGWAQERVLQVEDIKSWDNKDKLFVMITATCSFAGYDDSKITTAGEEVILNKTGGGVALFTTSRAVYASANKRLAQEVYNHALIKEDGEYLGLGRILAMAKNTNAADTLEINARKFTLLGDPAMRLSIPKYKIITSSINGRQIDSANQPDTLRALQKVTVEGYIVDENDQILNDFEGTIIPTIYDKPIRLKTLKNDSKSHESSFDLQQSVLFKGTASVINGKFSYEFQMPKDIKFSYGYGKISHYASNGKTLDAKGSYQNIIIGGTDTSQVVDNDGPSLLLYMNDENFAYGGYTNDKPVLLIKLEDFSGINVTGSSIGHDITAVLDNDNANTYIMNQYYKSTNNEYRSGAVNYPLSGLSPGEHFIKVKAWDIYNNPTEKELKFIVIDKNDKSLHHVMNYPNPFVNQTNFRFEHGLPNVDLEIICHIFTVSGKLVKTITEQRNTDSQSLIDIQWDGTDDYGAKLANGVYVYKIIVKSEDLNISKESNFEKLVIIN